MIFYINHFSLIIFYHSVWLGFVLFGLRAHVHSQLVQFMLVRKGFDNHHCHNKPPDRKWAGVWMISCPEEMVLRIWGFWKESVEIGSWRQRVEFSTVAAEINWDFKHRKMCRCNIMAEGFRFMPLGLVKLRTFRLSAWVT